MLDAEGMPGSSRAAARSQSCSWIGAAEQPRGLGASSRRRGRSSTRRASAGRRALSHERARRSRRGCTGLGAAALPSGSSSKKRPSARAAPAGSFNSSGADREDQEASRLPSRLSDQPFSQLLGQVAPVLLQAERAHRIERLRVVGVEHQALVIRLEGEIGLPGPAQGPAQEEEVLGVHGLEEELVIHPEGHLVPVLSGRCTAYCRAVRSPGDCLSRSRARRSVPFQSRRAEAPFASARRSGASRVLPHRAAAPPPIRRTATIIKPSQ